MFLYYCFSLYSVWWIHSVGLNLQSDVKMRLHLCKELCKMARKIFIYTSEEVKKMKPRSKFPAPSTIGDEEPKPVKSQSWSSWFLVYFYFSVILSWVGVSNSRTKATITSLWQPSTRSVDDLLLNFQNL